MKIENYREQPAGGSVVAVFDVYWEAAKMTLRNLKLMNAKGNKRWIAVPCFKEGEKWVQYWEFAPDKMTEFKNEILSILNAMVK